MWGGVHLQGIQQRAYRSGQGGDHWPGGLVILSACIMLTAVVSAPLDALLERGVVHFMLSSDSGMPWC